MNIIPHTINENTKPDKFCPGCGHSIVLKTLGELILEMDLKSKTLIGLDIGCSLLAWDYFNIKSLQTHHGRTIPVMSGYKKVVPDKVGIAYVGDGGAYAIGLQSLMHAANRNDAITVIVINNTLYGMTGGQMAPTTLAGEKTDTTPEGRKIAEKGNSFHGPEILSRIDNKKMYLARTICTQPKLVKMYLKKAIENQIGNKSFSLVEILSMCPTNWRKNAKECINYLEKDVASEFKLGEINENINIR